MFPILIGNDIFFLTDICFSFVKWKNRHLFKNIEGFKGHLKKKFI